MDRLLTDEDIFGTHTSGGAGGLLTDDDIFGPSPSAAPAQAVVTAPASQPAPPDADPMTIGAGLDLRPPPGPAPPPAMPREQRPGVGRQFVSDLGRGVDQLQALGYGLAGMAGDAAGLGGVADWGLEGYRRNMNEARANPPVIGSYKNIDTSFGAGAFASDLGRYAVEAVAENLPMFLPSLATGGIGAMVARRAAAGAVTSMVETKLAEGLSREAAEVAVAGAVRRRIGMGAVAGAYPSGAGMEMGSIYGDIEEKTGQRRPGLAAGYGAVAGALEVLPEAALLTRMMGPAVAGHLAQGLVRRLGVAGTKQFLAEGGTEALQTIIENAAVTHADPTHHLWTQENVEDIINSALKGGIAGGVRGVSGEAAGHVLRVPMRREAPQPAVTAADAASPIPTDLIAEGRAAIVEDGAPPTPAGSGVPDGAVPASVLLGEEVTPLPAADPAPSGRDMAPMPSTETAPPSLNESQPAASTGWGLPPIPTGVEEFATGWVSEPGSQSPPGAPAPASAISGTDAAPFPATPASSAPTAQENLAAHFGLGVNEFARALDDVGYRAGEAPRAAAPEPAPPPEPAAPHAAIEPQPPADLPKPILNRANGKPFETAKSAALGAWANLDLRDQGLVPIRVKGGWGLVPKATPEPVAVVPAAEPAPTSTKPAPASPVQTEPTLAAPTMSSRAQAKAEALRQFDEAATTPVAIWKGTANAARDAGRKAVEANRAAKASGGGRLYGLGWEDGLTGTVDEQWSDLPHYRQGWGAAQQWAAENPRPDGDNTVSVTTHTSAGQETRFTLNADADAIRGVRKRVEKLPLSRFRLDGRDSAADTLRLSPAFDRSVEGIAGDLRTRLERAGIEDRIDLRLVDAIRTRRDRVLEDGEVIPAGTEIPGAAGRYVDQVIEVALASPDRLQTLGHEMVHALRDLGVLRPAEWRILERAAQNSPMMARIRRDYAGLNLSDEAITEEVVAEMFGDWMAGQPAPNSFARRSFERIRDFFQALGNALRGYGFTTPEMVFRAIERGDVGRRGRVEEAGAREVEAFQALPDDARRFSRDLDLFLRGELPPKRMLTLGRTPAVLQALGAQDVPLRVSQKVLRKVAVEKHSVHTDTLARLPELLADPVMVFDSATQPGSLVAVLNATEIGGEPLIAAIHLASGEISFNSVASVYGQRQSWFERQINDGRLRYVHTENAPAWLRRIGLQLPKWKPVQGRGDRRDVLTQADIVKGVSIQGSATAVDPSDSTETSVAVSTSAGQSGDVPNVGVDPHGQNPASNIAPVDDSGNRTKGGDATPGPTEKFSLRPGEPDPTDPRHPGSADARKGLMLRLLESQPIDRAMRVPFDLFGGVNERGEWKPGLYLHDKAARIITEAEFGGVLGPLAWMNPALRKARAGLVDRYGLDPAYVERDRQRGLDERRITAKVPDLLRSLADQGLQPQEMATLHDVLTGEAVPDGRWLTIALPIREAIDQMGAEAVDLGLLSAEAYERNRGKYLHRVYLKHEADMGGLSRWASNLMARRRQKIQGDQFKGRGMFLEVTGDTLMRHTDEAQTMQARSSRLRTLERRRGDLERRRAVAAARAEERSAEMGGTLERRMDLSETAAGREASPREKGRAQEQGVVLSRQSRRARQARALLDRIDGQLAAVKDKIAETEARLTEDGAVTAQPGQRFAIFDKVEEGEGGTKRVTHRAYLPDGTPVPGDYQGYTAQGTWEVRGTRGGKVVLWRDFTKAERVKMGEIVDARYGIAKTYMLMAHDLSTGRFFRDIAANPEWSRAEEPADGTWAEAADYNRRWADGDVAWVRVPDTMIPKSRTKRYGALAGRFVRAEIWRDMAELESLNKPTFWDTLMRQWKLNKTARNPVVHMNNVMSNVVFMDLADVRAADLARAAHALMQEDAVYREAVDNGAFGADMVAAEIRRDVLQPILDEMAKTAQGGKGGLEAEFGMAGKLAHGLFGKLRAADQGMLKAYQTEDEVFRMALYLRRREQGASAEQAALEARDHFVNYDIRAPWVNAARRTALPFIAYTYRAVPVIAKAIAARPWKLAKYAAMTYAFNALSYAFQGLDDDDEDRERRSLREVEQGYTWIGLPRMLRLPVNDQHGNPVFLDIRRWIPGGDTFDLSQGQSAIPLFPFLQPGGPLAIGAELFLNRQAFNGQDITNRLTDDAQDRAGSVGSYLWKAWMPSAAWIPGSWYWDRIGDAINGVREPYTDRPYSLPQAVASSVGIKVKPQDVEAGFTRWALAFRKEEEALKLEARKLARDRDRGAITQRAFESEMAGVMEKRARAAKRMREVFGK